MNVTDEVPDLKARYDKDGWCTPPRLLSDGDLGRLRTAIEAIGAEERPDVVYESGTKVVRAVHGCHLFDEVCARVVRLPSFVTLAESLLGAPVYVYQFKVNFMHPRAGAAWPWHQDYAFWHREDGMAAPDAVNLAVFLDDVDASNGPLKVIPGSHQIGLLDGGSATEPSHDWRRHVAAALEYTVRDELAESLVEAYGVESLTGPAGTVVAFNPSLVHSSSDNTSEHRRAMLLITYNRVDNAPAAPTRPEFLVSRDTTPIVPLTSDRL